MIILTTFEYPFIKDLIAASPVIVVTTHHNPDGDAIGSALAMAALLKRTGKEAIVVVPNDYPSFLKWMPGNDKVLIYQQEAEKAEDFILHADLIFCLDYNALDRTGKMEKCLRKSPAKKILIDHHLNPVMSDFDFHLSLVPVSSTSELIYRFIEGCSWGSLVDDEVATGLFVGIMTDTGSFSFACNYPETFQTAAALLRTGINAETIHRMVYDTYSESRLRLLGFCLSEKLTVLPEFSTAYIALSRAELERFNYQVGDTEGIVNYALSIDKIKIAVLLTERKDRIRISFRSKGDLSVNKIANEHFNGGGHRNAAGGDSYVGIDETINKLKKVLLQYREDIDRSSAF
jgi:bifunctional oligoribonuclease and PAP phosphatase NrnA